MRRYLKGYLLGLIVIFMVELPNYAQELPNLTNEELSLIKNPKIQAKINFDISQISPEGLIGKSDNLRSVSYEFCIPAKIEYLTEIQIINPQITYYLQTPGRIRCNSNQYLCIGDTYNLNWKAILMSIASLDYVERIDQFYGE